MKPSGLDEAINMFKGYVNGKNGFDELDFKKWLTEEWQKPEKLKLTESQITVELEQQIQSYIELHPSEVNEYSVGAFLKHLRESYS